MNNTPPMTPAELQRIERKQRTLRNKRGRRNPSVMPDRLARTSAFAPRRQGLITDSNFSQVYEVPGYSVVEVRGRELGSQHRDAIYALFRMRPTKITTDNPEYRPRAFISPTITFYETKTTWRSLLKAMGRTEHVNNLMNLMTVFTEIQQVNVIIHEGRSIADVERIKKSRSMRQLPDTPGSAEALITGLNWLGAQLDSAVIVKYGTTVLQMIEKAHLVSINADVQFRLKSDHAKVFWPFIDSQPGHTFIEEERLAQLSGRDLWADTSSASKRSQFRKECREAFRDMVAAKGLKSFDEEITGSGWHKGRRWRYVHAAPSQFELDLLTGPADPSPAATA